MSSSFAITSKQAKTSETLFLKSGQNLTTEKHPNLEKRLNNLNINSNIRTVEQKKTFCLEIEFHKYR